MELGERFSCPHFVQVLVVVHVPFWGGFGGYNRETDGLSGAMPAAPAGGNGEGWAPTSPRCVGAARGVEHAAHHTRRALVGLETAEKCAAWWFRLMTAGKGSGRRDLAQSCCVVAGLAVDRHSGAGLGAYARSGWSLAVSCQVLAGPAEVR